MYESLKTCYRQFCAISGTFYSETDLQSNSVFIVFMNMGSLETASLKM